MAEQTQMVINTSVLLASHPDLRYRNIITPADAATLIAQHGYSRLTGAAIIMPIGFGAVQYQKRLNGEVVNDSFPGIELPPATVVSFERAKRIISTEIAGRDGEVNEFTGFSSWKISIRSVLVNEENPDEIPEQGIRDLRDLFDVTVALPMLCDMCEWLGIYEVVIDSFTFHDVEANAAQPFSMTLRSDYPFEFKIKKGL
jgi:Domain of unknown function (DUF6046)